MAPEEYESLHAPGTIEKTLSSGTILSFPSSSVLTNSSEQ